MAKTIWQPDRDPTPGENAKPPLMTALTRGLQCKCPHCGQARLFSGYLRLVKACPHCATVLGTARADDAPPYFTIVVVGHIVVPLLLWTEKAMEPSLWLMSAIFLPLTAILTLALLRPIKGATVGAMHTFGMIENPTDA
jgi:uncharacterized protein (DUF983 family)